MDGAIVVPQWHFGCVAINVDAADGCVRLRGSILQSELPRLMQTIARVRGCAASTTTCRG
jgi:hypothetical protein